MKTIINKINWVHLILLTSTPLIAIYGILTTQLHLNTIIWFLIYYFITATGITAGYHRYFSHRSFKASVPLQLYFAIFGGASVQGSILWWSKDHRVHHRYTDTEKDPYSAPSGLLWSHIGWMIMKKDSTKLGKADIADLKANWVVQYQHKYYPFIAFFFGVLFPTIVAGLGWGDWRGGYFYAGILRMVMAHHATFCVNSLAHYLGSSPFDDKHSSRDHIVTALVTLGEGYHNFHHQFPSDYRNAVKYYQYDPTKWFIYTLYLCGFASELKTFPNNQIDMSIYNMKKKHLDKFKTTIDWGIPKNKLPSITFEEFQQQVRAKDLAWIVIDDVIIDVSEFINEHPGGPNYLKSSFGKDATKSFSGQVYEHSNAAHNLLLSLRIATIKS